MRRQLRDANTHDRRCYPAKGPSPEGPMSSSSLRSNPSNVHLSSCPEGTRLGEANVHNRRCLSRRVRYLRTEAPPTSPARRAALLILHPPIPLLKSLRPSASSAVKRS